MDDHGVGDAVARLKDELGQDDSAALLRAYLAIDDGEPIYTGSRFDDFDGGGDRPEVAMRFTPADVVAVTFLSVQVPPRPTLWLVEDRTGQLQQVLRAIPTAGDPSDREASRQLTDRNSAANRLWSLLDEQVGLGWVTVSKLLARKRPHLLPVYDQVVKGTVRPRQTGWWTTVAEAFSDPNFVLDLTKVRQQAGAERLSLLRTLDVIIWMRHHDDYRREAAAT